MSAHRCETARDRALGISAILRRAGCACCLCVRERDVTGPSRLPSPVSRLPSPVSAADPESRGRSGSPARRVATSRHTDVDLATLPLRPDPALTPAPAPAYTPVPVPDPLRQFLSLLYPCPIFASAPVLMHLSLLTFAFVPALAYPSLSASLALAPALSL